MVVGTPESTSDSDTGAPLLTVTLTPAEVAWFPAASKARADSVCAPLAADVVFQEAEYGDVVSVASRAPSTRNSTRVTPTASEAVADTVTVPLTVAPAVGAVRETVGGVVSVGGGALLTVTPTPGALPMFPAASKARALRVWAPLAADVVFHEAVYGAVVSVDSSAPSARNSTFVTPTASEAVAEIVAVPLTVAPALGAVTETVGAVVSGAVLPVVTRTATQSREKSRLVELATLVMRTRRPGSDSSAGVHARPQVSAVPPRT